MSEVFDCLVIGAGPGGLAAAASAAEAGMRVCLIDDNPRVGGQIWRSGTFADNASLQAEAWHEHLRRAQVEVLCGWRALDAGSHSVGGRYLRVEGNAASRDLRYSKLILAPGARELSLPFPGWTLPGIYGAGGLQAFAKSGFDVRGKRVVVAGTGPLLLAVAAHLQIAGANVVAVVEQTTAARLGTLALRLACTQPGKLLQGARYRHQTLGTRYYTGCWISKAHGDSAVRRVTITDGWRSFDVEAQLLGIGYHLVPNTELAQLLGCELDEGFVRVDGSQRTSVEGIYCAGEITGIGGVDKSLIEGHIAGLSAAGDQDRVRALFPARDRHLRFTKQLASTYALRPELRRLAEDATLVCRCEDVPHGTLRTCRSWREAKLHTRCGMGPCQARVCGPAAQFLYGWKAPTPRPPLFPANVSTVAPMNKPDIHAE